MRLGLFTFLLLITPMLVAAQSESLPKGGTEGSANSGLSIIFGNADSLSTQYFYMDDHGSIYDIDFLEEMPPNAQYDPVKLETIDYINTGNMGSSAYPLHYSWFSNINFNLGYHQFDVYKKNLSNTKFVRSNVPLTNLGFSPFSGRENFIVDALFSNAYKEELVLNVDYRRINQNGYFQNQVTKATNVGFHLHWTPKSSYSALFSMFVNNNSEQQNGGITTDSLFGREFYENLLNIPVFLTDASSRYENRTYILNQFFSITKDSSLINIDLHHHFEYENGYFRYFDNTIEESEYDAYPKFVTDDRGLRHYVRFNHLKNNIDFKTNLEDNILLKSGISQNYYKVDDERVEFSVNEISAYGDIHIQLYNRIKLFAKTQLGLVSNNGNLSFESRLLLDLPGSNLLSGGFNFSRYASSYIQRNLSITQTQVWSNDFEKQVESEFWASIFFKRLKTKITGSQMLLDNKIYLVSDQSYFQNSDVLSLSKLIIENKIDYGMFHLENTVLLQTFSENVFNFPSLWAKNIFYVNLSLFGNIVDTNLGIESRMTPARKARFYHPILSDFYSTNEDTDFYPDFSLFGVFDVDDFRIFLRAENFSQLFNKDLEYHYLGYPQNEYKLRFGFRWLLTN